MRFDLSDILAMVARSIRDPRAGAAEVLALGLPRSALWTALALVVVLSALLSHITSLGLGAMGVEVPGGILGNAFAIGALQYGLLVATALAIFWIGRAMGGQGSFDGGLAVVTWLQFVMVCIQVLQTVALLIAPPVGNLIGLFGLVLFLWMLTNFVAVLHGFQSLAQVFVMIIVSTFGLLFILSLVLAIAGVRIEGVPV